jgi:hypothetical protein
MGLRLGLPQLRPPGRRTLNSARLTGNILTDNDEALLHATKSIYRLLSAPNRRAGLPSDVGTSMKSGRPVWLLKRGLLTRSGPARVSEEVRLATPLRVDSAAGLVEAHNPRGRASRFGRGARSPGDWTAGASTHVTRKLPASRSRCLASVAKWMASSPPLPSWS